MQVAPEPSTVEMLRDLVVRYVHCTLYSPLDFSSFFLIFSKYSNVQMWEALLTAAAAFLAQVELLCRTDHSRLFVRQPQSGEPPATAPASPENSRNQSRWVRSWNRKISFGFLEIDITSAPYISPYVGKELFLPLTANKNDLASTFPMVWGLNKFGFFGQWWNSLASL